MKEEKEYLRSKAETWAAALRSRRLRKNDAWYCLTATIMKTIEYPLVVTTFTPQECAHIMAPILKAGLHAVRVQRLLPRTLVYAPLKYQGLGIPNPWITQLIEHIHVFLRHGTRNTLPGQLLRTNLENLTLELGSAEPFWNLDYPTWEPLVTPSWLKATWRDLHASSLSLQGPLSRLPLARIHDVCLMDRFVAEGMPAEHLCILNDVRMFKQVTRLSDITTADGIYIDHTALTNQAPSRPSLYEWPRCTRPPVDC